MEAKPRDEMVRVSSEVAEASSAEASAIGALPAVTPTFSKKPSDVARNDVVERSKLETQVEFRERDEEMEDEEMEGGDDSVEGSLGVSLLTKIVV